MANTTNFGWETPDDTDLVKDGALAMRTLGNAIDTSLVDLKGGTTNQILAKNSNTDMDFKWVANDVGDITAVTAGTGLSGGGTSGDVTLTNTVATTFDAKGDLVVGTGADTFAKLVAGSNGDTLVADSSTTTGLRYTAGTVQGNPVLNSAFQVWQRGTSLAISSAGYTADRWYSSAASAGTVSRQPTNDTTNLPFIQYCARVQRTAGSTSTTDLSVNQSFETINSIPFVGKTVTFSFYARAGANFSAASNALTARIWYGTGTDQNLNVSYTGATIALATSATLTTTWQRFTVTGTIASTANEIALQFFYTPVGTAGAADLFEITGVQIDVGSVALPFRTYAATLAGELAACQRYFQRIGSESPNSVFSYYGIGFAASTTNVITSIPLKVVMRTAPSMSYLAAGEYNHYGIVPTAIATDTSANHTIAVITTSSGLTLRGAYPLYADNTNSSYIDISAEL